MYKSGDKMKHTWKVTIILLVMFLTTQLIGLAVIKAYTQKELPYGMQPPAVEPQFSLISIITAFIIAIVLIFLLTRIRAKLFLRLWFFIVIVIAIGISINSLLLYLPIPYSAIIAAIIALPLAFYKIFKQNMLVHNLTELIVYPGIAAVFVPILNVWTIIILLILISAYDIYAVWHSGFMQRMAKFQINELKLFAGFFVPYLGKKEKDKIRLIKQKYKKKEVPKILKKKKIKVSLAILGGGDVIFPIIAAGIFLKTFNIWAALLVTACATIALALLFIKARKGKFYPAMPFLTAGIFIGMALSWIVSLF